MRKKKYVTYINSTIHTEYPQVGKLVEAVSEELAKIEADPLYDKLIPKHFRIKAVSLQPNYTKDMHLATVRVFNHTKADQCMGFFHMVFEAAEGETPRWKLWKTVDMAQSVYSFMQNEMERWKEHNIDVREGLQLWLAVNS